MSLVELVQSGINAVCFDVDSTVCTTEGIDELARFLGVGEEVANVTKNAMDGAQSFREALQQRLAIMSLTQEQLTEFVQQHPPVLCEGVLSLITTLTSLNIPVFLISGGFHELISPIIPLLNGHVSSDRIIANKFVFGEDGIATFDPTQPTSASGGKAIAVNQVIQIVGGSNVIMIGDGVTDLEARPPAKAMIGYGGIAARENVIAGADWFVYSFDAIERLFLDNKQ